MTSRQLILLTADSQIDAARALAGALQTSWPFGACPDCRVTPISEGPIDELMHDACGLLLIPGADEGAAGNRGYLRALDQAHDASVPALILGDIIDPARPDLLEILHMPMHTTPTTIAAVLVGMLGRQGEINRVRMQLDTTARVVTNVHEEMEKLDEELQAAAMVQRDFLPSALPKLGSISVGALWRPTSYVSGDYYDVRQIDDHRIGVFIADAAGA